MRRLILSLSVVFCLALASCARASQLTNDAITKEILAQFQELTKFPHPSGHEEAISNYLVKWAENRNLTVTQDETYNVIIDVPATKGMADKPLVALQAHMDMVFACKNDTNLNPLTTKIITKTDGKYLTSDGNTSLGADDGIGLSIALKIAEGKMPHGPLKLLFTTNEEGGLTGIRALKPQVLENVSAIINLDTEEEGNVIVSSAECDNYAFNHIFQTRAPEKVVTLKITLSELAGGHSGLAINEGRGNAIRILCEALKTLSAKGIDYEMASFNGGTANNAIPSWAEVIIVVNENEKAIETVKKYLDLQKEKYKQTDPKMTYAVDVVDKPTKVISTANAKSLLGLVTEMPDGVYSWSKDIEKFPVCSSNLGIFRLSDGVLHAKSCARSSSVSKMKELDQRFRKVAKDYGVANIEWTKLADVWEYNPNSKLLQLAKDAYKKCYGKEIKVSPIHAGLECGTFALLKPGIDIIAIGPTTYNPHTVNERCDITTIFPLWQLIEEILKNMK